MKLVSVRPVYLDIWRVVCLYLVFLAWYQIATLVIFSSVRACFSLPVSCFWLVLPVSGMFFIKVCSSSLFQFSRKSFDSMLCEPHSLNWCKVLINALRSSFNSMSHLPVFYCGIENIIAIISSAFVYKHRTVSKLISIRKLVANCFRMISFAYVFSIMAVSLEHLYFTR